MCTPEALEALNSHIGKLAEDADLLQSGPFRVVYYNSDVTSEWARRLRTIVDGLNRVAAANGDPAEKS
jgi:hypothetical protein